LSEDFPAPGGFRPGSLVAGYRIESRIGAGGMAVVFRARDERLGRLVALKVMAPQWTGDEGFRRRFVAESRAAAAVDDPHIIPVYEAGEENGVLFIAMRFVAGSDLRKVLEREGPVPPGRLLELISPVASALDAAHAAGLVHRDVKPANILVDERPGRPDHVYLADFGLSKIASAGTSHTTPGQYLGTPHYSAPEQVQGHPVDGCTDQYALACVACELLTGQPPFQRKQGMAVLLAHLSEPPPSLARRRPGLPGAVDQVLARALAKAPNERYGSCRDFADALREALPLSARASGDAAAGDRSHTGASVQAKLAGLPGRTGARPAAHGGIPARAVSPLGGTAREPGGHARPLGTPTVDAVRAGPQDVLTVSRPARGPGDDGPRPPRRRRRRSLMIAPACVVLAFAGVAALKFGAPDMPPRALSHSTTAETPGKTSPSGLLTSALVARLSDPDSQVPVSVAFGPDGTTLAAGDSNGSTYLWNVTTRKITAVLSDPASQGVGSVAFGPVGTTLAVSDGNGSTYLWNVTTRKITAVLTDPASHGVDSAAFGPGGTTLAVGDHDGTTYLWDVATRKITTVIPGPAGWDAESVAFGPGGTTLAIREGNGSTYLWNVTARKTTAVLADPATNGLGSVAFGPGGTTLAASDGNGSTYLWNLTSRKITAVLTGPAGCVEPMVFGPAGSTLAAGNAKGATYLWDVTSRKTIAVLTNPDSEGCVDSLALGPDGSTLAVGDANGSTYLWRITN
jgi:WD40 repeat protein